MPSAFLGIYKAVFAYQPQSDQELSLQEGDILYVTEKSNDDDWWTAKKKTGDDEEEEPVGLVPNNYIEEATPIGKCKAMYDYERQTEEELSFLEDSVLDVYDSSDPDWILVGFNGEYGFAPANYIEQGDESPASPAAAAAPTKFAQQPAAATAAHREPEDDEEENERPPPMPPRPVSTTSRDYEEEEEEEEEPVKPSPAAAVAAIIHKQQAQQQARAQEQHQYEQPAPSPPTIITPPPAQETAAPVRQKKKVNFTPEYTDDDDDDGPPPALPTRPRTDSSASYPQSPPPPTNFSQIDVVGVHKYQVNEIISKKKHPATLEMGNGQITLTPHRGTVPAQTWKIEDLKEWSADGKRVGFDLLNPVRSLDLHVGSKDTAEEVLADVREMRSLAQSNVHLRDVMVAATSGGKKLGTVLYNFDAQGEDEASVKVGDEVIILDDTKSEEWWMVKRAANGNEGVVPSSYIEVKKGAFSRDEDEDQAPAGGVIRSGTRARSVSGKAYGHSQQDSVGPGMKLPVRNSSLNTQASSESGRSRGSNDKRQSQAARSRPNPKNVRTWTDRTGTFNVDAEFLNCRDGVIHLHKVNGVKIAVPVVKMSRNDLEYVERVTGMSLDEDKPLSDIRSRNSTQRMPSPGIPSPGITIDRSKQTGPKKDDYDWFEFFLACGVEVHACQRYATNFHKDNMDETILPDVTPSVLRTLGLKEGDILRVMKFLDLKYNRGKKADADGDEDGESKGGLFAGPGGTLKNNTRKGRPAPPVQTSDVVDPKAFDQKAIAEKAAAAERKEAADEWTPKPSKQETTETSPSSMKAAVASAPPPPEAPQQQQQLSGAMKELSMLSAPLQPTVVAAPAPVPTAPAVQTSPPPQQPWTVPSANIMAAPLSSQQAGMAGIGQSASPPQQQFQQMAPPQQQQIPGQFNTMGRQRPAAPQINQGTGALIAPPPPARPLSAPGQQAFQPPMQQQVTGFPNQGGFTSPPPQAPMIMQPTGFNNNFPQQQQPQQQFPNGTGFGGGMQPQMTGMMPQMTGFPQQQQPQQQFPQQPQQFPAVLPQPTGTAYAPLRAPFQPTVDLSMPTPLIPQKPTHLSAPGGGLMAPLKPQATGPPPQVKFGMKKLTPQPTGRKANLGAATPENPFGF